MSSTKAARVILYARVSTPEQARMYGLEAQVSALRAHAAAARHRVIAECVDDGVSGARLNRPELNRLRELVAAGKADRVLCPDVSRLARDVLLFLALFDELQRHRVAVEFLNFPAGADPATTRFILVGMANTAEYERAQIRMRTHDRGRMEKARGGHWAGGRWAYGYRSTVGPDGRRRILIVDLAQAKVVRLMFEWYDAGQSLYQIARELNRRGIPTGRKAAAWVPIVVRNILRNPGYMGRGWYNRTSNPTAATRERNPLARTEVRDRSEWLVVEYPPLVDAALFQRVQGQLTRNQRERAGRPGNPAAYLKGLLFCPTCGRRLVVRPRYYECPNLTTHCRVRERRPELERDVWTFVSTELTDETKLARRVAAFERRTAVDNVEAESGVVSARVGLARADAKVAKLVRLVDQDEADELPEELTRALKAAKAARDAARESLAAAEAKAVRIPALTPEALRVHTRRVVAMLKGPRFDNPVERATVLRLLLTRIDLDLDRGELRYTGPLFGVEAEAPTTGCVADSLGLSSPTDQFGYTPPVVHAAGPRTARKFAATAAPRP